MVQSLSTFVFFDIEATGLPDFEFNRTKITELALVACSKVELQNQLKGTVPRVLHKLTLCVNPRKRIDPDSTKITGLDNYNLEYEKFFSNETGQLIKAFFNQLQAPICLVAHNGFMFDFPILRKQLDEVGVPMHDIFCVDSLEIFRNIANNPLESFEQIASSSKESAEKPKCSSSSNDMLAEETTHSSDIEALLNTDVQKRQQQNEKTPSSRKIKADQTKIRLQEIEKLSGVRVGSKSKRALFPCNGKGDAPTTSKKRLSFKLVDIYARLHGAEPTVAHNAEEDAINLMKCCIAVNKQFIERSERSAKEFMAIKPLGRK